MSAAFSRSHAKHETLHWERLLQHWERVLQPGERSRGLLFYRLMEQAVKNVENRPR
jgi:hypothetical protein